MRYLCLILLFLVIANPVYADDFAQKQADAAGMTDILEYYERTVNPYLKENGVDFKLDALFDSIYDGNFSLSPGGIINGIISMFTGSFKKNLTALSIIMMISVLCGFLGHAAPLGEKNGSSEAAFYISFCVICIICIKSFTESVEGGVRAITIMSDFVKITAPALITLTAVSGGVATATAFSPVLYSSAAISVTGVSGILVPIIYAAFSLSVVGCAGDGINLERVVKLLKNSAKWIMGFLLTIFSGISAIYAAAGSSMNALAGKTIRFAMGNFIPFVGGMLSDSLDMAAACTNLVKGAAGVGLTAVVAVLLVSCGIKLAAQLWLFRLAAAFTAPVGDARISKMLDEIADCISIIFAAVCMCAFLFLVIIAFMIS